jgi:mannose-6-phosphate isomerase-like protein (cupin superfamily)
MRRHPQNTNREIDMQPIRLAEKFGQFSEHWRPKIAADLNGQEVRLVKIQGTFPWHNHPDGDEMFLVWRGRFRLEFRDGSADLGPGEFMVVPRGVEHRPVADEEAEIILFVPAGIRNTGNLVDEVFTAPTGVRV